MIIISTDENDYLAAIYFKTGDRGGTGSIKMRMQVSSDYCYAKVSVNSPSTDMNPDAHSVHMALRAVVVYLFTNITPKYTHTEN